MLYQNEFAELKKFYKTLNAAKREMAGLMVAMPVGVMLFTSLMMFIGVLHVWTMLFLTLLSAGIAAAMLKATAGIDAEWRRWQADKARAVQAEQAVALRMAAAANDPGAEAEAAPALQEAAG